MKNNEAINIQEKEEDVRYARNTLYVLVGLTILGAIILSDPWRLIDASILAILAFMVTLNNSKTALLIACIYYAIDSLLAFSEYGLLTWMLRVVIHYLLIRGTISIYQLDKAKRGLIASYS
ncbi:MAG: hypothetical protein ACJ0F4_01915 [Gammaproteobacteria bacterium]